MKIADSVLLDAQLKYLKHVYMLEHKLIYDSSAKCLRKYDSQ